MSKDDRNAVNPFSGKKHLDMVDDDEFLMECYNYYYEEVNNYQLLDNTENGQMIIDIASRLISAVNDYLKRIGRYDYVEDYYDWEVHLVNSDIVNACCFPGGKILVYAGILSLIEYADELAFVLAHEISHALLDHSRTSASVDKAKNSIGNFAWMGSFALDLMGFEGAGELTRAAVNVGDVGASLFLTQPWGRDHELEADKLGLMIAYLAGYNVNIIPDFWQKFSNSNSNNFDFFSTHPSDNKRIAVMRESLYEISSEDIYSRPLLSSTPTAKQKFRENPVIPHVNNFNNSSSCPKCGSNVDVNDNFCMECGFKLHEKKCRYCGGEIKNSDNFCMSCGKKIE